MPEFLGGPKQSPNFMAVIAELRDWRRNRFDSGYDTRLIDEAMEALDWARKRCGNG